MWDYVPTRFFLLFVCRPRGRTRDVGSSWVWSRGYDRVDPSPRDHQFNTCAKDHLSDCDRSAYLTPRGDAMSVGCSSKGDRTIAIRRPLLKPRGTFICVGSPSNSDPNRTALRMHGRTPRSWLDRAAIAARSSRNRTPYAAEIPLLDPTWIGDDLRTRSTPDRNPIVAWSIRKSRRKLWLIIREIEADLPGNWSPRHRSKESFPRRPQTTPTTASIGHDLRVNFPF